MDHQNNATALALHIVEIDGSGIEQGRTYTDKKDGLTKPLQGRQTGYLNTGDRYPLKISVDIPNGAAPYRPGLYLLSGSIFESGKYDRLEFKGGRDLRLVPLDLAIDALTSARDELSANVAQLKTGTK